MRIPPAAPLVLDGQVAEIQTGSIEADVARIEIAQHQGADVVKTTFDQEALARITRPPDHLDRLVVPGGDVAERPGAEIVDGRADEIIGVICARRRGGRSDVAVGGDCGSLPRGAVGKGDRGHAPVGVRELVVERERVAHRLVGNRQVREARAGPIERNIRQVEIVEDQRADIIEIAVAIDGECLARIGGSPDDFDCLIVPGGDVAECPGTEIVDGRADEIVAIIRS